MIIYDSINIFKVTMPSQPNFSNKGFFSGTSKKLDFTFLFLSFLLGLCIDFFLNSGGVNAAATLFMAYIRMPVIKAVLRRSELDYSSLIFRKLKFSKSVSILSILIFIQHFIVFQLEYFRLDSFFTIILKTILTGIFTLVLVLLSIVFFTKKKFHTSSLAALNFTREKKLRMSSPT